MREAVLVSNGPGELYGWVRPVLQEFRRQAPDVKVSISLIPCQFASGNEAEIARSFEADAVTTPNQFLGCLASGRSPKELGADSGFVISLGGNTRFALRLSDQLGYPTFRYSFVPFWDRRLRKLFLHDRRTLRKARLLGAPRNKLQVIGNLVADAVRVTEVAEHPGRPHILLFPGSRDTFAIHLIPFMIALADQLVQELPNARFIWPVSRLLREETVRDGIAGHEKATLGGIAGRRQGDEVMTPSGARIELVAEAERYAHMRSADLAITIPGTNTLELGIAGAPSVVMLPLNKPEIIPLEGPGHWLSLVPLVGKQLKRRAVKLFVEGLSYPVSLPNQLSGEALMREITGKVSVPEVAGVVTELLSDPQGLKYRRARLRETMPQPGAAGRLVSAVLADAG